MKVDLILSQGRIADRKDGTILGAALTATALERSLGTKSTIVGSSSHAKCDDWSESLPAALETLNGLQHAVEASLNAGNMPVLVANTCSASLATLPVVARLIPDSFVLWIDAHGDFNTPQTTQSGYLGGMVVAAACGLWESSLGAGLRSDHVVIVGGRDIDESEQQLLDAHTVTVLPPNECSPEALKAIVGESPVWVHIDWDVLNPGHIPADYAVEGGLLPLDVRAILTTFASQIRGLELAEFHVSNSADDYTETLKLILNTVMPGLPNNVFNGETDHATIR